MTSRKALDGRGGFLGLCLLRAFSMKQKTIRSAVNGTTNAGAKSAIKPIAIQHPVK
jgi:hypothetical protein